jgi:quinol monooxygenase YgiN
MPASPWRSFGKAEPEREYLVLLSYLPLKSFWRMPAFLLGTAGVMKQLAAAPGLIGYSLLARPIAKNFWTLSVWNDDAALKAFINGAPHVRLMSSLIPHMGKTNFVRWRIKGSGLPVPWDDALRHMQD